MEARELRIGNYIYWDIPEKENVVHTVIGIDKGKPKTLPISLGTIIEEYKPIPLTEEWLLKFGFKKNESKWFQINYFTDCSESAEEMGIVFNIVSNRCGFYDVENEDGYAMTAKRIYYVHQLQNLYYCLCGEELTTQELNQ